MIYCTHAHLRSKKFDLPKLEDISEESVKQHLGLYEGYVKNFNAISKLMAELAMSERVASNPYELSSI